MINENIFRTISEVAYALGDAIEEGDPEVQYEVEFVEGLYPVDRPVGGLAVLAFELNCALSQIMDDPLFREWSDKGHRVDQDFFVESADAQERVRGR